MVFLAFDVFFAIFCVVLASLIGIALCCCFPCIIAILYAVAGQVSYNDLEFIVQFQYFLTLILMCIYRKVHQMLISVSFQSIDFKSVTMKISLQLELVEWFPLQQAVGIWQANVLF